MTTKALADFVASVQYDKLSPETVRITKAVYFRLAGSLYSRFAGKTIQIIR